MVGLRSEGSLVMIIFIPWYFIPRHRRSQDFLWGVLFHEKNVDDLFSRRPEYTG